MDINNKIVKRKLNAKRANGKAKTTLKDINVIIEAYITGDYTLAHKTKCYNLYSGEYCTVLEILNELI